MSRYAALPGEGVTGADTTGRERPVGMGSAVGDGAVPASEVRAIGRR
jgi:hypothetical protein